MYRIAIKNCANITVNDTFWICTNMSYNFIMLNVNDTYVNIERMLITNSDYCVSLFYFILLLIIINIKSGTWYYRLAKGRLVVHFVLSFESVSTVVGVTYYYALLLPATTHALTLRQRLGFFAPKKQFFNDIMALVLLITNNTSRKIRSLQEVGTSRKRNKEEKPIVRLANNRS